MSKKEAENKGLIRLYIVRDRKRFVPLVFLKLFSSVLESGISLFIYFFLDRLENGMEVLQAWLWGLGGFSYVLLTAFTVGSNLYLTNKLSDRAIKRYKDDVVNRIFCSKDEDYRTGVSSSALTLVQKDLSNVQNSLFLPFLNAISLGLTFVFSLVLSFFLNPILAAIVLALSVFVVIVPLLFGKRLSAEQDDLSEKNLRYSSFLGNAFGGKRIIQNGKAEGDFSRRNEGETEKVRLSQNRLWFTYGIENGLMFLVVLSLEVGVLFFAGILYLYSLCSLPTAVSLFSLSGNLYNPLAQFVSALLEMKSMRSVAEKIRKIPEPTYSSVSESRSATPDLRLSHLSLGYGDKVLLEDVSLTVPFGRKVLITGESGSGKTTLFECLLGYRKPLSGSFSWGGEGGGGSSLLSYCPQEPYLFLGSLEENITLFSQNPDPEKLEKVIRQCALSSFEEKRGLNTPLNEFDAKISLGEKQRISLARALYLDRPVLLLDEVTSSLDPENSVLLLSTLHDIRGKTIILISHQSEVREASFFDLRYQLSDRKIVGF